MEPGEVDDLLADAHAGVEAALLGHVAEAAAFGVGDWVGMPADAAGVEMDEAEDAAHGRGLARAVRPEEAEHAPGLSAQAAIIEGDDVAELLVQAREFEHWSTFPVRIVRRNRERRQAIEAGRSETKVPAKSHRRFSVLSEFS